MKKCPKLTIRDNESNNWITRLLRENRLVPSFLKIDARETLAVTEGRKKKLLEPWAKYEQN